MTRTSISVPQSFTLRYRGFAILHSIRQIERAERCGTAADCKSAIRQTTSLRYDQRVPETVTALPTQLIYGKSKS